MIKGASVATKWLIQLANVQNRSLPATSAETKYRIDFENSRVRSRVQALEGRDQVLELLKQAKLERPARVADESAAISGDYWSPDQQREAIRHLRRKEPLFRVSIASPSVAVMRTLLQMNSILEYDSVTVDFSFAFGRRQVEAICNGQCEWDFLILADAPLFFMANPLLDEYLYEFPIYAENQRALTSGEKNVSHTTIGGSLRPLEKVLMVGETTLHLQARLGEQLPIPKRFAFYSDLFLEAANIEPGRAILIWEPAATELCTKFKLASVPGTNFNSTLGLYSHRRFQANSKVDADAFKAVFLKAWNECKTLEWDPSELPREYLSHYNEAVRPV